MAKRKGLFEMTSDELKRSEIDWFVKYVEDQIISREVFYGHKDEVEVIIPGNDATALKDEIEEELRGKGHVVIEARPTEDKSGLLLKINVFDPEIKRKDSAEKGE